MADAQEKIVYTFQNPVRSGFANIIKPRKFNPKPGKEAGDPRYDVSLILAPDSPDLAALKTLVTAEAKKFNPGKRLVTKRLTEEQERDGGFVEIKVPWKDGTKEADFAKENGKDQEFFRGMVVVKASSKFAPQLSYVENGKIVQLENPDLRPTLEKLFYAGAYIAPHVSLHGYKARGRVGESGYEPGGVGLWLDGVHFVKHGTRIGGQRVNAAEVFKAYAGQVSGEDPTGGDALGGDDEI
jgi:hypothetical protein